MDADVKALVERVEESFGIKFDIGELNDESYFSDLCDAVRSHIGHAPSEKCFASIVFWRLRRACVHLFGTSKRSIAPWTPTDIVLPRFRRRRAWLKLAAATGLKLPGLEYSSLFTHVLFWGSCVLPAVLLFKFAASWLIALCSILLWPVTTALLFHGLRAFADELPAQSGTFRGLSKTVVGLNYGMLVQTIGPSRESEMLEALRNVVADLIDLDPHGLIDENPRLMDLAIANDGFRAWV